MPPGLCSFCTTPWWTSTSGPAPPSRVLSFGVPLSFFFDNIVMISRDQFPSLSLSVSRFCCYLSDSDSQIRILPVGSRTEHAAKVSSPTKRIVSRYRSHRTHTYLLFFTTQTGLLEFQSRPHSVPNPCPGSLGSLVASRSLWKPARNFGQDDVVFATTAQHVRAKATRRRRSLLHSECFVRRPYCSLRVCCYRSFVYKGMHDL